MEDEQIVALYHRRSEQAILETAKKYGSYLFGISNRILSDARDAEECVSDTYQDAWEAIPPAKPAVLKTFLGKLTRRRAIDLWRKNGAQKRGGGELTLALEELSECVAGGNCVDAELERQALSRLLHSFLQSLPPTQRRIFLCRYWYLDSVAHIAKQFGFSQSKVTAILYRTRNKLRLILQKEDYL